MGGKTGQRVVLTYVYGYRYTAGAHRQRLGIHRKLLRGAELLNNQICLT